MLLLLVFAFLSGLVTIAAPCIWPLLPIVLSSSAVGGKAKPFGITIGIISSFAFFTLTLSYIVKLIPFDPNILRLFAVIIIGFFGLALIIPALNQIVEGFVSRLSSRFGSVNKEKSNGFVRGFITGLSLGIVWSPCAGPILATIATLSATQKVNIDIIIVTVVYAIGVGIPLFLFASFGNHLFTRSRFLNRYLKYIQQAFGMIMILTAFAIMTNLDKTIQLKLLDLVPTYSNFINQLEGNSAVSKQLNSLKGSNAGDVQQNLNIPAGIISGKILPNMGKAPEFTGIDSWLNTNQPITMQSLKDKVVLVDFWTYTCINCIRTIPHVTSWYEKYKDKGFVVIGVHTPEFAFEHSKDNVIQALKQFSIQYPVAQDNEYATWNAFDNQYWPAEYLIDVKGNIRHSHFGEGEYDQTEDSIRILLQETGQQVSDGIKSIADQTPTYQISPETYLGAKRMQYYFPLGAIGIGSSTFDLSESPPINSFSLGGDWNIADETAITSTQSTLNYHFTASNVYIILRPNKNGSKAGNTVKIFLDGNVVKKELAGKDVVEGVIQIDSDRLYHLLDFHGKVENHTLKLEFGSEGIEAYTFTFG